MRISFEVTRPRWASLGARYRKLKAAGVVLGAALVVAVPAAWASHLFADVPDSEPFHNQIAAIGLAGITTGCNPGPPRLYCPEDNVTRKAMAAFMHRGFGRVGFVTAPVDGVPVLEAEQALFGMPFTSGLPPGALPGAAVFVKGDAEVTFTIDDASGCPCAVLAGLFLEGYGYMDGNDYAYGILSASNPFLTIPVTGMGTVTTAGPRFVAVVGARFGGTGGTITATGNLTTSYFPFSSTGTNTPPLQPASKAERAKRAAEVAESLTTGR
jgi:hypothetical protein